jgi:GNAT superfamily N-acetyltransferase
MSRLRILTAFERVAVWHLGTGTPPPNIGYRRSKSLSEDGIEAVDHDKGYAIGYLNWDDSHRIMTIEVDPEYRRQGIATAMFNWAKQNANPKLRHSVELTDEGHAWGKSMGWNPSPWRRVTF